jgi:hypothetical protein
VAGCCDNATGSGRSRAPPGLTVSQWIAAVGTKAKGNYPEPRAAVQKMDKAPMMPPLDYDARWLPIEAAPALLTERATALAIDLTDALLRGHLRCIRSAAGERKRVAATAWHHRLILSAKDGFRVLQRHPDTTETVQGWRFFVWEPDLKTMGRARVRS